MRLELFIFGITAFFVYNTYHDGKYTKLLVSFKKYYQMFFFVAVGVGIYLLLKRSPTKGKHMLQYANNIVKYMPIDKSSMSMITPIFDFTTKASPQFFEEQETPGEKRMQNSGKNATNRSVSGMKKKYVASQQDWKCGSCGAKLDYTYEVDHKIRLEHGGGNDVQNLIALCRECHGKKTVLETF
jgi:hypothetical protein